MLVATRDRSNVPARRLIIRNFRLFVCGEIWHPDCHSAAIRAVGWGLQPVWTKRAASRRAGQCRGHAKLSRDFGSNRHAVSALRVFGHNRVSVLCQIPACRSSRDFSRATNAVLPNRKSKGSKYFILTKTKKRQIRICPVLLWDSLAKWNHGPRCRCRDQRASELRH